MAVAVGNAINVADIANLFNSTVIANITSGAHHLNNPPMDGSYFCVPSNMMDDINNLPTPSFGVSGGKITASSIATALINVTQNLTRVGTFSYVRTYRTLREIRSRYDPLLQSTYRGYGVGYVITNTNTVRAQKNGKVIFTNSYVRQLGSTTGATALNYSPASYFVVSGATITGLTATGLAATSIVVPAAINGVTITAIGSNAFRGSVARTIEIPSNITSIGNSAFQACTALTTLTIYGSSTSIGQYAFYQCTALTTVTFYGTISSIGMYAFRLCSALTDVNFYCNIQTIGQYSFYQCSAIKYIRLPSSVTTIGTYAFYLANAITTVYYEGSQTNWNALLIQAQNGNITTCTKSYNFTIPQPPQTTTAGANVSHTVVANNPITVAALNALCSACLLAWQRTSKYHYSYTNATCHNDCHSSCHYDCHNDCHSDCYSD